MRTVTVKCDRCGEEINKSIAGWQTVKVIHQSFGPSESNYDLCQFCAMRVEAELKPVKR